MKTRESMRKLIARKRKSEKKIAGAPARRKRKTEVIDLVVVLRRVSAPEKGVKKTSSAMNA